MAKFTVTLKETVFYTVEVEAEGEEAARVGAVESWNQSQDPANDYCGSGQGVEVDGIQTLEAPPWESEFYAELDRAAGEPAADDGSVADVEAMFDKSLPAVHEYLFDVKLFAAIRVKATSEAEAREMIKKAIDCNDANLGAWPNGDPITCEVSLDEPENDELVGIDGIDMNDLPFHPESPEGRAWMADRLNADGSLKD